MDSRVECAYFNNAFFAILRLSGICFIYLLAEIPGIAQDSR
jgi:hypothetical protein